MVKPFRPGLVERLLGDLFRVVNRRIVWYRLGFLLSVVNLVALRTNLRRFNLYDTETREPEAPSPGTRDVHVTRTPNGSYNDLGQPGMGMAGTRFGRNVPIASTFPPDQARLLGPNPRLISRKLLTRTAFIPASTLNVFAGAWVQFMIHDWFSHARGASPDKIEPYQIPIDEDDPFPQKPLIVPRTPPDSTRSPADEGKPPTFLNVETHWWDASQIYGSSDETVARVRHNPATGEPAEDGKIHLSPNGLLPRETAAVYGETGEIEFTGVNGNWWIGLSALHTLFAREHNLICDRLKIDYPDKDGDWLFEKARLILAALIAKIHTVEWTPALLNTPALRFGMRGNWWGVVGEEFARAYGRLSDSEVVSGIIGSPTDHHGVRYSITEEFVAVYRMHSLMRDDFSFRRHVDNGLIRTATLPEVAARSTHLVYGDVSFIDVVYSLATENPGALVLHNYPRHLQNLRRQDSGEPADLAAVEILRDRERGVPRYCEFRRLLDMKVPETFLELTGGRQDLAREIEAIYGDLAKVDLMIGMLAEPYPEGFAFSDTEFRIFILMASRRLKSDRFFTEDYRPEVYTQVGLDWIANNSMKTVVLRHFPQLAANLRDVRNAFFPWRPSST
jgi:Animal haem peroxidase